MRRLTFFIVLVAFIFSCGGQWAAFQVIAWGNMIREYSQVVPLSTAVEMTLSGQYPCVICKAIAERKSAEQQKDFAAGKHDLKFPLPVVADLPQLKNADVAYPNFAVIFFSRVETPPTPPPRAALS